MRKKPFTPRLLAFVAVVVVLGPLLGAVALGMGAAEDKAPDELLQEADRYFQEKSFRKALVRYRKVLQTGAAAKRHDDVRLRVGWCLRGLKQWVDSISAFEKLAEEKKGSFTEVRARRGAAEVLFRRPHWTYFLAGKDIGPKRRPGASYRNLHNADIGRAKDHLDRGHALLAELLKAELSTDDARRAREERTALNYLFSQVLESLQQVRGGWWSRRGDRAVAQARLAKVQPLHRRVLALLKENYLAGVLENQPRNAARALYHRGMYLRRYAGKWWSKDLATGKLPATDESADSVFARLLDEFPKDGFADDARYGLGLLAENRREFTRAIGHYDALEKGYPESPWVKDARQRVRQIRRPVLAVDVGGVRLPGAEPSVKLRVRNVRKVDCTAYRVPLERYLADAEAVAKLETQGLQNLAATLEEIAGRDALRQNREAAWSAPTPDRLEHQQHDFEIKVPVSGSGAYLLEIKGDGVSQAAVLIVSDLAIVRQRARDRSLFFVADARTGTPVSGVEILARQKVRKRRGRVDRGRTDADGLWTCDHHYPFGVRYNYLDAFAWVDGRYACTGWSYQYRSGEGRPIRFYGFTDRGAYRPGQKVHYAAILRRTAKDGRFDNLPDHPVAVQVRDGRGKVLTTTQAKTDAFGMLSGEWSIPAGGGLGRYRITMRTGGKRGPSTTVYFRVEEYKRPEFEVSVAADKPVRAGEILPVRIDARYYFGGAVAGARVKYTIYRRVYHHSFRFQDPFAFLYDRPARRWWGGDRHPGSTREELVVRGEGETDAEGRLVVKVATAPWMKKYPGENHRFRVRAEVMDRSRRTIEGSGTLKVTRSSWFAAVKTERSFVAPGETAAIEIRTEAADGSPVAARGVIRVLETEPRPLGLKPTRRAGPARKKGSDSDAAAKPEVKETLVHSIPVETDANGRAFVKWAPAAQGYFLLRFEGRDETEAKVQAESPLWVCGKDWKGRAYRYQNLQILTDRRTYQVGETARVLINAAVDNPSLLLCRVADRDILDHRVIRVSGRSAVLEIAVDRAMQPNFFLDGTMLHGGQVFRAASEVFVPPVEQFLKVDVVYPRKDYRPGEAAEAVVRLSDHDGRPVKGRAALGVVDASLDYIQGDATQDIRRYFYGRRRSRGVGFESSLGFRSRSVHWQVVKLPPHHWAGMPPGWYGFPSPTNSWGADAHEPAQGGVRFGEERQAEKLARRARGLLSDSDAGAPEAVASKSMELAEGRSAAPSAPAGSPALKKRGGRRELAGKGGRRGDVAAAPAAVRQNFAETAYFSPAVAVGDDGAAKVSFTFPDSLTRWRTTARAFTTDTRVGQCKVSVVTSKNLLVRPQAPRFFRERDEVVLSAIVNSGFAEATAVEVRLDLEGGTLELLSDAVRKVQVEAGGELRIDWRVKVVKSGEAVMRVAALSARESDAVKRSFPVLRYGSRRTVTHTALVKADGSRDVAFTLPAERAAGSAALEVTLNPSIAGVLLDALPYLLEYPYGCVEQTMSRFLPAVVVRSTLRRMKVNLEELKDKRRDLPHARAQAMDRNPVFDSDRLHDIVTKGLKRIAGFQRPDGGFGWFPGGHSDPYMTAYVLYGLKRAMQAEVSVDGRMRKRALDYLEGATKEERNLHRAVYQCWVLTLHGRKAPEGAMARVYSEREALSHYGRALLALAAARAGRAEWARVTLENLEDFIQTDPRTGAASLPAGDRGWCWWNDGIETNAFALMAFNRLKPDSPHREGLMRWLVAARRGNRWRSTKDTAHALLALAGYMTSTGELDPDFTVTVSLNGEPVRQVKVTRDNLFTFDNRIRVEAPKLATGNHVVTVAKTGRGRVYATARLSYFSREDPIPPAGHEMKILRTYYRVTPEPKQVGGKQVMGWKREKLEAGAKVFAGDTLEIELAIDAFHDYEYVVVVDPKAAGFEAVAVRSGGTQRGGLWTYMEVRDDRVAFFLPSIPKGEVHLPYRVRAEVPGRLHAMPATGELMYAPDVGGSSASWKVTVADR